MSTILKTSNLTKKYSSVKAVNEVNMTINKGDIYGFIGKNGAGKTTLMKMVCGLASASSGSMELFESENLMEGRKRIGCVIEQPALYSGMTARENLIYYNKLLNIKGEENINEILSLVDLKDTGKKKTKQFSLGMKQRLSIGISLIGNPDFLVLDEPINGLDPSGIKEIRELLLRLNQEKQITILISSHILGELAKIATKYGVIEHGNLVEEFSSTDLSGRCKQSIKLSVNQVEKAVAILEDKIGIQQYRILDQNRIHVYDNFDKVAQMNKELVMQGVEVSRICLEGKDLEGYFLDLMGGN